MSNDSREISLRGAGPWQGLGSVSTMLPGPVTFRNLEGIYFNRDGTEMRREPGTRLAGRPFPGQSFVIQENQAKGNPTAGEVRVVLQGVNYNTRGVDCHMGDDIAEDYVTYIYGHPQLPDGYYLGTRVFDRRTLRILVPEGVTVDAHDFDVEGYIGSLLLERKGHLHGLLSGRQNKTVAIYSANYPIEGADGDSLGVFQDRVNVAAVVGNKPLDFDDPEEPRPPKVLELSTAPGFTVYGPEEGFIFWQGITAMPYDRDGIGLTNTKMLEPFGWEYNIDRRMGTTQTEGRVIVGVPGCGVLFQVDTDSTRNNWYLRPPFYDQNPDGRIVKMLGIPRGRMRGVTILTDAAKGGITGPLDFNVAVAYYDPMTGEVGLPSETFRVRVSAGANKYLAFSIYRPRAALLESAGLGALVFMSAGVDPADGDPGEMFPVLQLPGATPNEDCSFYDFSIGGLESNLYPEVYASPTEEDRTFPGYLPAIENHPAGGVLVEVARNRLFWAAPQGEWFNFYAQWETYTPVGSVDLRFKRIFLPYDGFFGQADTLTKSPNGDIYPPCAYGRVPDSYIGHPLNLRDRTVQRASGRFVGCINTRNLVFEPNVAQTTDYPLMEEIDFYPRFGDNVAGSNAGLQKSWTTDINTDDFSEFVIKTNIDNIGFSEEGFAGVSAGLMRAEVDVSDGDEVTGLAKVGDNMLVMTQRTTQLYTWSGMPNTQGKQTVSTVFGCISPHGIASGAFGTAWISQQGPVLFDGAGIQHIGNQITEFWDTAVDKDTPQQVLGNITAAVDEYRQIVTWTLRTNTYDGEDLPTEIDKACGDNNIILVWNYATNQFSFFRRDKNSMPTMLTYLPFADGRNRIVEGGIRGFSLENQYDLWGWDEDAAFLRETPTELDCAVANTDASIANNIFRSILTYLDPADPAATPRPYDVTGEQCMILTPDRQEVLFYGKLSSVTETPIGPPPNPPEQAYLDYAVEVINGKPNEASVWPAGARYIGGVFLMRMETNRIRFGGVGLDCTVQGVAIRAKVDGDNCFVRVQVSDDEGRSQLLTGPWGDKMVTGTKRFWMGNFTTDDIVIEIDIITDGQVAIKDIGLEVLPNERPD